MIWQKIKIKPVVQASKATRTGTIKMINNVQATRSPTRNVFKKAAARSMKNLLQLVMATQKIKKAMSTRWIQKKMNHPLKTLIERIWAQIRQDLAWVRQKSEVRSRGSEVRSRRSEDPTCL